MFTRSAPAPIGPTQSVKEKSFGTNLLRKVMHKKPKEPGQFQPAVPHGNVTTPGGEESAHNIPYTPTDHSLSSRAAATSTSSIQSPLNPYSSIQPPQEHGSYPYPSHTHPPTLQAPLRAPTLPTVPLDEGVFRKPVSSIPQPAADHVPTMSQRMTTRESPQTHDNSSGRDGFVIMNDGRGALSSSNPTQPTPPPKPENYQNGMGLNEHPQFNANDSNHFEAHGRAASPPDPGTYPRTGDLILQDEPEAVASTTITSGFEPERRDNEAAVEQRNMEAGNIGSDSELQPPESHLHHERKLDLLKKRLEEAEATKIAADKARERAQAEKEEAEYNHQTLVDQMEDELHKAREEGRQAAEAELNPKLRDAQVRAKRDRELVEEAEKSVNGYMQKLENEINAKDEELGKAKISLHANEARLEFAEQSLAQAKSDCEWWEAKTNELNARMHKILEEPGQQMDTSTIQETYRKLARKIEMFSTDFFQGPLYKISTPTSEIRNLSQDYHDYITDNTARPKLVQAYVWGLLRHHVFRDDSLMWSHSQQCELSSLLSYLKPPETPSMLCPCSISLSR
jgi:hypothetical protein